MNEFELADAKRVLNWQYWAPPLALTLFCLGFLAAFWNEEPSAKLFIAVFLGAPALVLVDAADDDVGVGEAGVGVRRFGATRRRSRGSAAIIDA